MRVSLLLLDPKLHNFASLTAHQPQAIVRALEEAPITKTQLIIKTDSKYSIACTYT